MPDRNQTIEQFLAVAGWQDATRTALAGDASARRYERLFQADTKLPAVLMDAPPESGEVIGPFLKIARFLLDAGFSAPEILAYDTQTGLILMEDLGDDLYARVCVKSPELETPLYEAAIDALCALHQISPPDLPNYSQAIYLREARLLTDWYLPVVTADMVSNDLEAEFEALITEACAKIDIRQKTCVLRDYHAENLLWLPERVGVARVGQLDFQDALLGHPAYDLVSLLEDARRDTSANMREDMIARYLDQSGADPVEFRQAYGILGAQRNLKIVGIFTRLFQRDGKQGYIDLIPRVWEHLERDLQHPVMMPLREFLRRHVPAPTPELLRKLETVQS